jgi:hypothetical protein
MTDAPKAEAGDSVKVDDKGDFVKLVSDFTKDVLTTFPELAEGLDENLRQIVIASEGEKPDEDAVDYVWDKCSKVYPPRFFDILYQNVEIFAEGGEEDVHFLPGVDFRGLWSQDISDSTRDTIWKYLQLILLRVVSETSEERSFGDTAKLFEAIDENSLKEKLEQTIKDMETMFSDKAGTEGEGAEEGGADDAEAKSFNAGELPNPDDIHNHISGLMQGKLGRLAQEIAEETAQDLGEELGDVKTADQAFHKLFKNPGKLMSLVKKVGNKLEDKIKSGEIKESELLKEAGDFVSKMKDMPGMGNLKNVFGQMGMPGLGKDMKVNMGALNNMMRGAQTRDRLRAKLAKKQQEREATSAAAATTSLGAVQTGTFSTGETVERSSRARPSQEAQEPASTATATTAGSGTEKKKRKKNKKGKK